MPTGFENKKSKTNASFAPSVDSFDISITSLISDANKIGSAIRQHWGIENSVHWTLDVTFHVREAALKEHMSAEFVFYTAHRILLYYVALHSMP